MMNFLIKNSYCAFLLLILFSLNRLLGAPLVESGVFFGSGIALAICYMSDKEIHFFGASWRKKILYLTILFFTFVLSVFFAHTLGLLK